MEVLGPNTPVPSATLQDLALAATQPAASTFQKAFAPALRRWANEEREEQGSPLGHVAADVTPDRSDAGDVAGTPKLCGGVKRQVLRIQWCY
jgi:hypothetical protein